MVSSRGILKNNEASQGLPSITPNFVEELLQQNQKNLLQSIHWTLKLAVYEQKFKGSYTECPNAWKNCKNEENCQ